MDDFGGHLTLAGVVVYLIQRLKNSKYAPFITAETDLINRWAGVILAILTGFGIHMVGVYDPIAHTYQLAISGLDPSMILEGLSGSVETFVMQQLIYHGALKGKIS